MIAQAENAMTNLRNQNSLGRGIRASLSLEGERQGEGEARQKKQRAAFHEPFSLTRALSRRKCDSPPWQRKVRAGPEVGPPRGAHGALSWSAGLRPGGGVRAGTRRVECSTLDASVFPLRATGPVFRWRHGNGERVVGPRTDDDSPALSGFFRSPRLARLTEELGMAVETIGWGMREGYPKGNDNLRPDIRRTNGLRTHARRRCLRNSAGAEHPNLPQAQKGREPR